MLFLSHIKYKLVYCHCCMKRLRAQFVPYSAWPEIAHCLLCFAMLGKGKGKEDTSLSLRAEPWNCCTSAHIPLGRTKSHGHL